MFKHGSFCNIRRIKQHNNNNINNNGGKTWCNMSAYMRALLINLGVPLSLPFFHLHSLQLTLKIVVISSM